MTELAAGKSPKYRIRALKRRIAASAAQARLHARLTETYADMVTDDMAEIARLEREIAGMTDRRLTPRWRIKGDGLELIMRRKWLGQVGPMIDGQCRYVTTTGAAYAPSQEEAKRRVECEMVKL